ncbi:MAG TPA: ATP-binding cassette domain-containing protein [Candidatus Bathyarchaeia archaeon]
MEIAIKVQDLTKRYTDVLAVDHIDFEVHKGEFFGFLGPNGAGKTTTINILTGVTKATSGTAAILGHDLATEPVKAKEHIGVVPDTSNLYDEMTAWANIIFCAKLHGVPKEKREKRANELLKIVGLQDRRNDRLGTFSRGMKKRMMIAAALVHEPEILFLDEPTTGLDVQSAREVRGLIRELNRKGATVFLTTHYLEEADVCCQRVAIIAKGKIITENTPEKLKLSTQVEQVIEVSFDHSENSADKLKRLSHVRDVVTTGDKFRLYVDDSLETLPLIFDFAKENHLRIVSINTLKPTLEDAFVKLTGLHPELMSIEKEQTKPNRG